MGEIYLKIAVLGMKLDTLVYSLKGDTQNSLVGKVVFVPLKNKLYPGLVVGVEDEPNVLRENIKDMKKTTYFFNISLELIKLTEWMSKYYITFDGLTCQLLIPRFVTEKARYKKSLIGDWEILYPKDVLNFPKYEGIKQEIPQVPTYDQEKALKIITPYIGSGKHKTFLVHGVTGSGKTILYLWLSQIALNKNLSTIVLVPEIALTPQHVGLFQSLMQDKVIVYHSGLKNSDRFAIWHKVREEVCVVVGPRSAVFLPVKNLGLIIIDEEHDWVYKNEREPFYHARDVAIMRGYIENIPVVLGSATPSLESYFNALKGKYELIELKKRIKGYWFPIVRMVDMRKEKKDSIFSLDLLKTMKRTVYQNKQVILYLNRRGFSPVYLCKECGYIPVCKNCDVSLTLHKESEKDKGYLLCHYCGTKEKVPQSCPLCNSTNFLPYEYGTKRVVYEVKKFFPQIRVERLDLDVKNYKRVDEIVKAMREGKINILVGTQMVSQGLDFPQVDLIGVLNPDLEISFPDFRSFERIYHRVIQISGRARRGGIVIIQSYRTSLLNLEAFKGKMERQFYIEELRKRKIMGYPPFKRLIDIEFSGENLDKVIALANTWFKKLHDSEKSKEMEILGPVPYPLYKLRRNWRYRILLKIPKNLEIHNLLKEMSMNITKSKVKVKIDPDPYNML